jgi:hypothetical protein
MRTKSAVRECWISTIADAAREPIACELARSSRPGAVASRGSADTPASRKEASATAAVDGPGATEACAQLPGSRLVVLPEAGHLCNIEAPDEFNGAVLRGGRS